MFAYFITRKSVDIRCFCFADSDTNAQPLSFLFFAVMIFIMQIEMPLYVENAIDALRENGYDAYIVGGCVRDVLMGGEPKDWDITTDALPEQISQVFSDYRQLLHGEKYGTVTILFGDMPVEITTYRTDGEYSDNRRPDSVRFTRILRDDLSRRDFTINALAYSRESGLVDCFGGARDLADGMIRCVGDARERFGEDALRILRALRFAARLSFKIEAQTAFAIHLLKDSLKNISYERINAELSGILLGAADGVAAVLSEYHDVMLVVIPELRGRWDITVRAVTIAPPDLTLRLALLLCGPACSYYGIDSRRLKAGADVECDSDARSLGVRNLDSRRLGAGADGDAESDARSLSVRDLDSRRLEADAFPGPDDLYKTNYCSLALTARDILKRLRFKNETIDNVSAIINYINADTVSDDHMVKLLIGKIGEHNVKKLLAAQITLAYASRYINEIVNEKSRQRGCASVSGPADVPVCAAAESFYKNLEAADRRVSDIVERGECCSLRDLKIDGRDLTALGFIPGKTSGRALWELLVSVVKGECPNERGALMRFAENILGETRRKDA